VLDSRSEVETLPWTDPSDALEFSISEARQIYRSNKLELFEYLMPSPAIPMSAPVHKLANQFFRPGAPSPKRFPA
jgi:hypothetical protein